ncbi:terpenoid synthase [Moniliophthora roreri MCA 2997]|uniref:Terpene synthase n=2 Tax=Moniliophthora roreri TaxID=221103 RepID=V2YG39_MONRO|nr:terpenoid synthase [Moniliophthora roreri MCA 2997]KAI3597440.1 terpenoid synthase [Moniliophthora roreri]
MARIIVIPDFESMCSVLPNGGVNPHHDEAFTEARCWIAQYHNSDFGPNMTAFMESCKFELAGSYTYPHLDKYGLRATMDWLNILWFFDEVTDTETGKDARRSADIVCHTLRDSEYNDGTSLCRMITDFRIDHLSRAGPETTRRFLNHCDDMFSAVAREAGFREQGTVLSVEEYLVHRKETSGVRVCYDMAEFCIGIDLPGAIYDMEDFRKGYEASLDFVCLSNDLFSYNAEQSKGHSGFNILTVLIKAKSIELQEAADYVGSLCTNLLTEFRESQQVIEECARTAKDEASANTFRDALCVLEAYGHWVRGGIEWSFESERYFGKENKMVRKSLTVVLSQADSVSRPLHS